MKKVKLYIRTPFAKDDSFLICDELTDEVYASTGIEQLAPIIKNALESFMNKNREVKNETNKIE